MVAWTLTLGSVKNCVLSGKCVKIIQMINVAYKKARDYGYDLEADHADHHR